MRIVRRIGSNLEAAAGSVSLVGVGERLFTSGLLPASRGGLESEAHQVYQAAAALLHEAGSSLADAVRVRLWHTDPEGDATLRGIHSVALDDPGPALSIVQVSCLPGDAKVALEVEAITGAADRAVRHGVAAGAGWSQAVRVGREVWVAGLTAEQEAGGGPGAGHSDQVAAVVTAVRGAVAALGVEPRDVVATRHFIARGAHGEPVVGNAQLDFMAHGEPTSAGIAVEGVGGAGATFMFECEAVEGAAATRERIRTGRTFEVEHNYSRAVRVGDVLYVAGTTSLIPGEIVQHPGEVRGQVFDTLQIIRWAVGEGGLSWSDLVRTRSYIVGGPAKLFEAAEALREVLDGMDAAATIVGVPVLGRPEVVVEIEATAIAGGGLPRGGGRREAATAGVPGSGESDG